MRIKRVLEKIKTKIKQIPPKKAAPILVLLFVVTLSIGYSAYGTKLNIGKFLTDVIIEKDIRITGVSVASSTESSNACSIVNGDLNTVGSEISCGGENFYVISNSSTSNTVTLLSKYNINVTTSSPVQSSSAGTTYFAGSYIQSQDAIDSGYIDESDWCYFEDWENTSNTCLAYWTWGSGYVYNEYSNLYQYINAYKSTLKGKGVTVSSAKVMSKSEYNTLISGSCSSGCDWLYSTNYWLGDTVRSRTDQNHPEHLHINVIKSDSLSSDYCALGYYGIRPVVTMPVDEIGTATSTISTTENTGYSTYEEYNVSNINVGVALPDENSTVTYAVEITNIEATEMGILNITGLPDNLEYELLNYNLEEKICNDSGKCNLGISKDVQIKIKYKTGSYNSSDTTFDVQLDFNFQPFYTVTYTDITNNGYPSEVLGGDTLTVDLGSSAPIDLVVKMDGVEINDYTYSSGTLTIPNVSGNIEILEGEIICTIVSGDINTVGSKINCGGDNFYLISNDGTNIQMLTEYNIDTEAYRQNSNAQTIGFSSTNYWSSGGYSPAGNSSYNYVYDSNSSLYSVVEGYVSYLNSIGVSGATGKLLSYEQAETLGCDGSSLSCESAPSWVRSSLFVLGSAYNTDFLWGVSSSGDFIRGTYGSTYGVRPVITIPVKRISNYTGMLPTEYQQVEYIESTGTQYIDAGFVPNASTSIDVVYQTDNVDGYSQYITGSRDDDNLIAYALSGSKSNLYWVVTLNSDSGVFRSGTNARTTNKFRSTFILNNGTGTWRLKDLTNNSIIYDGTKVVGQIPATANMFIFAFNSKSIHAGLKIYSYKAYDNGILIRDLVPCYRKSDGEAGMYDLVNNVFYTNKGTGDFIISLPEEYQEVEYIESSGKQYIDTGFTPNQDTRVIADYQYTKNIGSFLFGSRTSATVNSYGFNISSAGELATAYGTTGNKVYATYDANRHTIDKNKNLFYVDGNLILTQPEQTFTSPGSLEIFALYNGGTKGSSKSSAKLYSFKIYDNGTLIRDLIPCYRKSDNVAGLFDIVNKVFYTNEGTGTFAVGNDIVD